MKKSRFLPLAAGLLALSVSMPIWAADVVSADQIAKVLTTRTKAVVGADGKIRQADPTLDLQIPFDFKMATLKIDGKLQLDQLALAFAKPGLAQAHFEVAGHTDKVGSYDYNMKLSTDRANAVRDYLNKQHGIALDRLVTKGYGFTRLANEQDPKNAANRRVEIRHLIQQANNAPVQQPVAIPAQQFAPAANTQSGGELIQRSE